MSPREEAVQLLREKGYPPVDVQLSNDGVLRLTVARKLRHGEMLLLMNPDGTYRRPMVRVRGYAA